MLKLYAHPFSSYSQKVLIALWANDIAFDYRMLEDPDAAREWEALWPIRRFPVLMDAGEVVFEASAILEHLDARHRGRVPLVHGDGVQTRMLDRFFDRYVMDPMQKIVLDHRREPGQRDAFGVTEAHELLDRAYAWLDGHMANRSWAQGDVFGMADCAAAPALFYADWVHAIPEALPRVRTARACWRILRWHAPWTRRAPTAATSRRARRNATDARRTGRRGAGAQAPASAFSTSPSTHAATVPVA